MKFRHFTFLGMVLALAVVPAAQAAHLVINDSVEAQITLSHDANWEFGALSNGLPFGSRVPGSTTARGESAMFSGSWIVNSRGNPDPGTGVIYFVEQAGKKNSCDGHGHHHHHHHGHHGHHGHRGHHSLAQSSRQSIFLKHKYGLADTHGRRDVQGRGGGRHRRGPCVSDVIKADWSTAGSTAKISFKVFSSECGENLGRLPRNFAGLGLADPTSPILINGLFRDPATAAPVAIPSNLTIQFVGDDDSKCRCHDDDEDDD